MSFRNRSAANYYLRAESMLSRSQHSGVRARLGECARKILTSETNLVDNKLQAGIFDGQRSQAGSGGWTIVERRALG